MLKSWALFFLILIIIIAVITAGFIAIKRNIKVENKSQENKMIDSIEKKDKIQPERVKLNTDDGVEIIGDYYPVIGSKFAGILLHMMPSDRKSYSEAAITFVKSGWSVLSIDLRGHGESINSSNGKLNYEKFTDKEHQESIFDVSSSSNFLKSKGFAIDNQFLVGASIGANLSLKFLSENKNIKAVVLLSPGLNYKGIMIEQLISDDILEKILMVSSSEDVNSYKSIKKIKENYQKTELMIFAGGGHGTDIFKNHKEAIEKVINWLKGKLL